MPTQFTGRIVLILAVVLGALWIIFPKGDLRKPDLKPGIDMVGGTSLLYEIKQPSGGWQDPNNTLANVVMESLKKRVDPQGVKNLIWRPQGDTRLEIQMPLSSTSGESKQRREEFTAAQRAIEATNVRVQEVLSAVEDLKGAERTERLKQLAMGSPSRQKLFDDLAAAFDAMKSAEVANDAAKQAEASNRYDDLREAIARQNVSTQRLQEILDSKPAARDKQIAELKQKFADFPQRVAAIDDYQKKYGAYALVRGNIDDAGELKRLLRGSGVLQFNILAVPPAMAGKADQVTISNEDFQAMVERLEKDGPQVRAGDTTRWFVVEKPDEFDYRTFQYNDKHYALAYTTSDMAMVNRPGQQAWGLKRAGPDPNSVERKVAFEFDTPGAMQFSDLTGRSVGKPLGIVLDDKLISAPLIHQQIGAQGTISGGVGGFSTSEQMYLINTLNAGSLPAQLTEEPISERTVGPQIGADNLRTGLAACMVGLVVVAIFLIGYYYLAGLVAFIAVLINLVLILGVMAMLNATFTLPGVAGVVLAIGAAVDANVLIFERLREEQHRGLSLRMALRNSYDRAFSAILDSNMTTVITSAVLYWLGTEEVKGFAITLLIGLVSSMFTALFVTKTIFGILVEKFGITNLSSLPLTFPKWDQMLQPKIDWIGKFKLFATISTLVIVIGGWALVHYAKKGELLDIEFASGTEVQFELRQPTPIDQVREFVPKDSPDLPSPTIVSVGTGETLYSIATPMADAKRVREVVLASLGPERLKIQVPSTYEGVDKPSVQMLDTLIFPVMRDRIDSIKSAANGFLPGNWQTFRGGAAFVMKNIDPPLSPEEILERVRNQSVTPGNKRPGDIAVESPKGPGVPTETAVVLISDENMPFDVDQTKWREDFVAPAWSLVSDAINKPATLQKVNNFDPQVAGETASDALMALILSLGVIMAYIWIRFGDLKYGTATMVAMLHDTLVVLAFIGLSHLLYEYAHPIANVLMLEPFRLNITVVAAVLTVMSYSMIDTIVVFDRIRENRGKFGEINKKILNDSINQTMSRTLLTAGTNIVTLAFMYVFGGPGIHGFTFVLLFGILIGTYSSVAIAAPLLLVGSKKKAASSSGYQSGGPKKLPTTAGQLQRA